MAKDKKKKKDPARKEAKAAKQVLYYTLSDLRGWTSSLTIPKGSQDEQNREETDQKGKGEQRIYGRPTTTCLLT